MKVNAAMEDQYIDLMIKLALDMQEQREVKAIGQSDIAVAEPAVQQSAHRAISDAFERIDQDQRTKRTQKTLHLIYQCAASVLKAAACLALITVIAVPVALAGSPEFRSKVMELVLNLDQNQGIATFSFQENPDASFEVPAEWQGTHFMSYIPEGFEMTRINPMISNVEYRSSNNRLISFGEYDESTTLTSGIDGCTISCIEINGQTAYVTEGVAYGGIPTVDVVWTNQRNWFSVITYGMSKEETLKIVLHVKPINP